MLKNLRTRFVALAMVLAAAVILIGFSAVCLLYRYQEIALVGPELATGWKSLALILAVVGFIALALFFAISLEFSKRAFDPIAEAWEKQTRFVADASHDLKTPLTVILANVSIMKRHPEAKVDDMMQWLQSTESEALDSQSLINDLLLLARIDEAADASRGRNAAQKAREEIDFSKVAESEVLMFESVAFESGITLESDIAPGIVIMGDKSGLKRLVTTLLDNACKYANVGGTVDVHVSRSADGKHASFAIHNTGAFIPEEDIPYVFDRFYRTDRARASDAQESETGRYISTVRKSHGLGLAIAHGIVEEHGGSLTVSSSEADGTTFTATFPL